MHYPEVLEHCGCGPNRLREIFTQKRPAELKDDATDEEKIQHKRESDNYTIRCRFEKRGWDRILQGVETNAKNARVWQAVDMAKTGSPVEPEMVPLTMFAQNRINPQELATSLKASIGEESAKRFITKDPESGDLKINIPRIFETHVNLVGSYSTRRLAAMDALWSNLYPLLKYDPRGETPVAQLKGDVVTERVDIIANQYGWRRLGSQWRRDMLSYSDSLVFPRSAWDKKIGWRFKKGGKEGEERKLESYVVREGLDLVNPHKSRRFYDFSAPLGGINTNTGPKWVGYWDITRFSTLFDDQSSYYNVDQIFANEELTGLVGQFPDFFNYYYDPCILKMPDSNMADTRWNDRASRVGLYTSQQRDNGVLLSNCSEMINPRTEGIGDYNTEVWIRLTFAGSGTIIGAEFMPSLPAVYGGINIDDGLMMNQSMCSQLLVYQDTLTNIQTQMIQQLRLSFTQLWLFDKDSLEPEILDALKKNAGNQSWWMDPQVLVYSASKLKDLGVNDPRNAFAVVQAQIQNTITNSLAAMSQVLNLCDRLMILSPNELGQANPREVAAREVQEISTSVQAVYSFINQGPREQLTALKQLAYESLVTNGEKRVRVPVLGKYTKDTVEAAGFAVDGVEVEEGDYVPRKAPIVGPLDELVYDYYFDSREGSERASDTAGAQALTQMLQVLLQTPGLPQLLGLDRLLEIVNAIIRMSGAPLDLQITKNDGEGDQIEPPPQPPAPPPGLPPEVIAMITQQGERVARLEAMLGGGAPPAQPSAPPPANPLALAT